MTQLLPLRHDLVFIRQLTDSCRVFPDSERLWVEQWARAGRPFWFTRQNKSSIDCFLGQTHYIGAEKRRIQIQVPWSLVKAISPPPLLSKIIEVAPGSWQSRLKGVLRLGQDYRVGIRVFGALVSQWFAGEGQLRAESDIDLLFIPGPVSCLRTFLKSLESMMEEVPGPRIDGEVRFLEQDVAWREFLHGTDQRFLVKTTQNVFLAPPQSPLSLHVHARLNLASSAIEGLLAELSLCPKPGLVSPLDTGAHDDMDVKLLYRSIVNLRHYFIEAVDLGRQEASFAELKQAGLRAESRLNQITGQVNTYRGGIFHLGLLLAAAARNPLATAKKMTEGIVTYWGEGLLAHQQELRKHPSHGQRVYQQWHRPGAIEMALSGYGFVVDTVLPFYQERRSGRSSFYAQGETLLFLMAHLDDANLLWRGGESALLVVQQQARALLKMGGLHEPQVWAKWLSFHYRLMALRWSPGGSADLLAFVFALERIARHNEERRQRISGPSVQEELCV